MNYYHTEAGELPRVIKFDYNGYKFDEVEGDDRYRGKRAALINYRRKLRAQIAECKKALNDSFFNADGQIEEDIIR